MNGELIRIHDELQRGYEGDCWHGPPLLEILSGVNAQAAAARFPGLAHSIWELVRHLAIWVEIVTRRTREWRPVEDPPRDFLAPSEASEPAWQNLLADLAHKHARLLEVISGLNPSQLEQIVPGKNYPLAVMLHGTSQHYAYHAGQIALLRKLEGAVTTTIDSGS
ncbi:hypothetical protein BH10PLA2_BH10PLA2_09700 [soil metagenome]